MNRKIIALLSDFGLDDPYVGIMKAVLSRIAPAAVQIDLSHLVPPGDIQRGAYLLWQAARDFPPGTVFLAVVDPGVGTSRKAIFLQARDQVFLGPDNGLFSYLVYKDAFSAWELTNPSLQLADLSSTFHGRDIFAPAAAYAALGRAGADFGPQLSHINQLPRPALQLEDHQAVGEVIGVDRFGNLITSLGQFSIQGEELVCTSWMDPRSFRLPRQAQLEITLQHKRLAWTDTYGSIAPGSLAGLIGSTGLLEIAANQGSARDMLQIERGAPVALTWP